MKSTIYIFIFFLLTSLLTPACTEDLTGPDQEALLEVSSSNTSGEAMADLSLRIDVDPYLYSRGDSLLYFKATTYLNNEGPYDASEIQVAFSSDISCQVARADNTSDEDDDGVPNTVIWDIDTAGVAQAGIALETECFINALDPVEVSAEVIRSAQLDPDSTPGNGRTEEDDMVSLRLDLTSMPCGDAGCSGNVYEHVIGHEIGHDVGP